MVASLFWKRIERSSYGKMLLFKLALFRAAYRSRVEKKTSLSKLYHIYSTMIKFGTFESDINKIQNIHKSRDTSFDFCCYLYFFTENN